MLKRDIIVTGNQLVNANYERPGKPVRRWT